MTLDSQIFEFMVEQHGKDYIGYLFMLYDLETTDGIDLGPWPTYEQFLQLRAEELADFLS